MTEKYLLRSEAAEYIAARGLPCSAKTLAKLASIGGGPAFRKFGSRAVYTPTDLNAWVDERMTAPVRSTTELQGMGAA